MKRVTIKDIAKVLGCSTSTVSRALSDHPDISEATKNRIKYVADELNYTTNFQAKFFRNQNSGLIALVLPEINMFFTPSLIKGINKALSSTKYSLITFQSNNKVNKEKEIIKQCISWGVEGVLISLTNETQNVEHLTNLKKAKIDCVILDKTVANNHFPSVIIDSENASFKAVDYLIQKGHNQILGLFGNPLLSISKNRLKGYKKAFQTNGIPINLDNIVFSDSPTSLDFTLPQILKHNTKLTSIFCMSDELLSKSLYHLSKMNIKVPEKISIISISDGVYPYLVYPEVTHVKDSGSKMGKLAAKVLVNMIKSNTNLTENISYTSTKLIELDSVVLKELTP